MSVSAGVLHAESRDMTTPRWRSRMASICLPLTLAPPILLIGQYGITLAEGLVLITGLGMLLTYSRPSVRLPLFLIAFLAAHTAGWLGSLYNSFEWGIPIGAGNLSIMFPVCLTIGG
jgi:hypothetical protein